MTDTDSLPTAALIEAALVEEGAKKSGLVWLTVGAAPPRPVWHVWLDGSSWLVSGRREDGAEQYVAGLADAAEVIVDVRSKDKGGRLPGWTAEVAVVPPGDPRYEGAVLALHAARLNAPDGEGQPARWARECDLVRLTPTGAAGALPTDAGRTVPVGSPAVTRGASPLNLSIGRRRRRGH
ncbi:hypothetical protein [Streptomyces sp. SID3343]|uniref:hypothetical protein n=1 Tax=Streptomyces sp. SID3343 TaxID=2690260 RepID=UPI00136F1AD9|nr:hypothetical protein [Streptomyces sp. SID3343]MYW02106.1 hypothetical protein [Streptomyces sp. SID3343]